MTLIEWEPTETGAYDAFAGLYKLYTEPNGYWDVRHDGGCIARGVMPDQDAGKKAAVLIYETHQLLDSSRTRR